MAPEPRGDGIALVHSFAGEPAVTLVAGPTEVTVLPEVGLLGASLRHRGLEHLDLHGGPDAARAGHTTGLPLNSTLFLQTSLQPLAPELTRSVIQAQDLQSNLLAFGTYSLILIFIMIPMIFIRRREFYRWFPRRQDDRSISTFERWLLLYTPLRWRALTFHVMFHAGVIVFLSDFMTYMIDKASGFTTPFSFVSPLQFLGLSNEAIFLGLALGLLCVHWMAHRVDEYRSG